MLERTHARTPKLCFQAASRRIPSTNAITQNWKKAEGMSVLPAAREMMFDLEVIQTWIDSAFYLGNRRFVPYRYLLARARELGLHTVLTKYQPAGQV